QNRQFQRLTFWMVPLRLRIIISTLCATSWVCLWRSNRTAGSMGGMSAGLRDNPRLRFLVIKLVRSPSWLTVPSSSSADEIVARRPSDWPLLPPPRTHYLPPHAWLISSRLLLSCIPRTLRTQTWAIM
uniref:Uncharacterized protein n=1 Tax=Acanthochromis polyacanthus TaxID=80966 RepID=A0A3Q1GU44_9TELE